MAHSQTLETIIALRGRVDNSVAVLGDTITLLGSQVNRISQQLIRFGTDSLDVFKDYEQNMADAEAALRTGTYRDRAAELEGVMDKLESHAAEWARTTKFHTSDVSAAISEAAHAGWDYLDMIEGIPAAMLLAQGGGMELTETLDYLVKALNATDTEFSDADKLIDQWITGANLGATNTREFGDAIVRMGNTAMFADSTEELFTLLTVLANVGATGSTAGTLLRNGMIRLIAPTEKANAAMDILGATSEEIEEALSDQTIAKAAKELETLGFTAFDEAGNLKPMLQIFRELEEVTRGLTEERRDQLLSAIFPTRSLSGALAILEAAKEDYGGIYEMIRDSAGAAQLASDIQIDTYEGRLEIFKSKWEELQRMTGEHLAPQVENVMAGLGGFIDTLTTMDPGKFDALLGGMEVLAGAGPALLLLGGAIKLLGSLGTAGGIGLVASLLVAGGVFVKELNDLKINDAFGNMNLDKSGIIEYIDGIGQEFRIAYADIEEFKGALNGIGEEYRASSESLSSELFSHLLTHAEFTEEDRQKLYQYGNDMRQAVLDGLAERTAADMSIATWLFKGDANNEAYVSLIELLNLDYENGIAEAERIGRELREALTDAFTDGMTEEEYDNIQRLMQEYNEAMAKAQAAESYADYKAMLRKAQTASLDDIKELSDEAKGKRDQQLSEAEEDYYRLRDKAEYLGMDSDKLEEYDRQWAQRKAEINSQYDEILGTLWETSIKQSDLSDAYSDLLPLADAWLQGNINDESAAVVFKDLYGSNRYAGEMVPVWENSTREQLGEVLAREVDALGGHEVLASQIQYYDNTASELLEQGETEIARVFQQRADYWKRLLAAEGIANNFSYNQVLQNGKLGNLSSNEHIGEYYGKKRNLSGILGVEYSYTGESSQDPTTQKFLEKYTVPEQSKEFAKIVPNPMESGTPFTIPVEMPDGAELAKGVTDSAQAELDANPGSWKIYGSYTLPEQPDISPSHGGRGGKFALGGRATTASIFGEAGPEWAIPEEHSARTAALFDAAREASGFTWPELLARNGGLNSNPQSAPYTIVYSPTVYAQDARDVEQKLNDDKKRFEKWIEGYLSEKQLQKEVAQYA